MNIAGVIILIVGAILFTVSFFIPERFGEKSGSAGIDKEAVKSAVKAALEEEMKNVKLSIDEAAEESINASKDNMERYMDRLTNEKMMAVNEYSDTVLQQIHKDHQEAVFLYDMIDSKHNQVKSTAAEINQIEKAVKNLAERTAADFEKESKMSKPVASQKAEEAKEKFKEKSGEIKAKNKDSKTKTQDKSVDKKDKSNVENKEVLPNMSEVELMFDTDAGSVNNNDRILALHKEGKSNMAIAKELGLGVGEVKLVIDLFKSY